MKHQIQSLIRPIGMLAGAIIGAGVFSLPFVFERAGIVTGLCLLAIGATTYSILHLMYADILLGAHGQHRFVGYVRRYLGVSWSYGAIMIAIVEMVCVLTIYLILSISFVHILAPGLSPIAALLIFWALGSLTMFVRLRRLATIETMVTLGIISIMAALLVVGIYAGSGIGEEPLIHFDSLLFPLAAILFSLSGRVALPPLINYFKLRGAVQTSQVRTTVIWGTILPALSYAVFVIAVLAFAGPASEDAITGILAYLPQWLVIGLGTLGFLTLWSSYIVVGLDVHDTLKYDLAAPTWLRLCVVVVAPVMLYLVGFTGFVELVSFVGGLFLVIEGIAIIVLWRLAKAQGNVAGLINVSRPVLIFLWVVFILALLGALKVGYY